MIGHILQHIGGIMFHQYRAKALEDIRLEDIPLIQHPDRAADDLAHTENQRRTIQSWELPQYYSEFVRKYHFRYGKYHHQSYRDTLDDIKSGSIVLLVKSSVYGYSSVLTPSGDLRTDLPLRMKSHLRGLLSRQQRGPGSHASLHADDKAGSDQQPAQRAQSVKKREKREITLTLGVFFDGTGNNAVNTDNMLKACTTEFYNLTNAETESILEKCAKDNFGVSGLGATSYKGYYTNVYWLNTFYANRFIPERNEAQYSVYIDGIGTEAGLSDSLMGQGFGVSATGVVAKTDKAILLITEKLRYALTVVNAELSAYEVVIKKFQFDIFGFSRGAAAARHFANRIQDEDAAIIRAIREGVSGTAFAGAPAGKTRFIGLFDTVAAIGTPTNGLSPHNADTGSAKIILRPGVAEKVFHIVAANECRFNFALNSVKPAWPELALPGAHSDIGGGYLPVMTENLFLTRPETNTVPLSFPDEQTRIYHKAAQQLPVLKALPSIAPILRTSEISVETWFDDRMSSNHYGEPQKRTFAALTLRNRVVKNDWSRVSLRVMFDAAQEAGVAFSHHTHIDIPDELLHLCEKAIAMGKAVRTGNSPGEFTQQELDIIAQHYIHCSANWNAIAVDSGGSIHGGASPSQIFGFVNRPDEQWRRTVYNMDGNKSEV